MAPQQSKRSGIRRQGSEADRAHGECLGQRSVPRMPTGDPEHPQPKNGHCASLHKCRQSTIAQRHAHHEEADRVIACVAEKIESVRLERCGAGCETSSDLHGKHYRIDG
jgi:hypothetical protein